MMKPFQFSETFRKLAIIGIIILIIVIFIFFATLLKPLEESFPFEHKPITIEGRKYIPIHFFWINTLLSFSAGALIFSYIYSRKIEKKLEYFLEILSKIKREKPENKNIILNFLSEPERKVIEFLLRNDGKAFQSDISKSEGMNKLKTHRAVIQLIKKGLIRRDKRGRTHILYLNDEVKELLKT